MAHPELHFKSRMVSKPSPDIPGVGDTLAGTPLVCLRFHCSPNWQGVELGSPHRPDSCEVAQVLVGCHLKAHTWLDSLALKILPDS